MIINTEKFTNDSARFTDVALDKGGGNGFDKGSFHGRSQRFGQKSLTCTRRTIKQDTFGRLDANTLEKLWTSEWKFDDLLYQDQ